MNKVERDTINGVPFANSFQKKIARDICRRVNSYGKTEGVKLPLMLVEDTYTQDDKRKSHLALSWREQTNQEIYFKIFDGGAVEIFCTKFDPLNLFFQVRVEDEVQYHRTNSGSPDISEYSWHGHYIDPFPEMVIENFIGHFSKGNSGAIDEGTNKMRKERNGL